MAERLKDYTELATSFNNLIIDLQVGILHEQDLNYENQVAIHEIIEASNFIVDSKVELYRILNNTKDNVIT